METSDLKFTFRNALHHSINNFMTRWNSFNQPIRVDYNGILLETCGNTAWSSHASWGFPGRLRNRAGINTAYDRSAGHSDESTTPDDGRMLLWESTSNMAEVYMRKRILCYSSLDVQCMWTTLCVPTWPRYAVWASHASQLSTMQLSSIRSKCFIGVYMRSLRTG